ncbi:hypothetical protein OG979_01260 [Actinomadura citrea]|uniref:hypothetical protein n=1 Tax=Actinomadura TaxID=1988 RepID=UPI002E2D2758|nr:hypothetical protein [Actinomadura citrea]
MSDEQEFLHKLARLADREHQRHQALQARPQAWEIQPGSPLADDEAKSERLQRPGARRHPHRRAKPQVSIPANVSSCGDVSRE